MAYDVIVVGAGPAGATAARLLAKGGAKVLLLDRARFPRDKPCGGGVTLRAVSAQDLDLGPVVERTICGARFTLRLGPHFDRRHSKPLTFLTQRCNLDEFLAGQAAEEGADFHDGESITGIELSGERQGARVNLRTSGGSYQAGLLIGADGANGTVARQTGVQPRLEEAVALEGRLPYAGLIPPHWEGLIALDLGGLAGGYGWVFPKGDHFNIGVGAWKYAAPGLRLKLAELCRRYAFDPAALKGLRGHHLPVRDAGTPVARGPIALIGDAAGLVDPLSGEGMHMAFISGKFAAEAGLRCLAGEERDFGSYQRQVEDELQPELNVSRQLQEMFNFAPPPYMALLRRSRRFWLAFCCLIRGEISYLEFRRRTGPLRLATDLFAAWAQRRRLSKVESEMRDRLPVTFSMRPERGNGAGS